MKYTLPAGALVQLTFLRAQFHEARGVDLDKPPSRIGLPTLFGGTDVVGRNAQTKFLLKIHTILKSKLKNETDIKTPEEWEANLNASRVMLAACIYVKSQISRPKANSALYRLINSNLGITGENVMDEEDKMICIQAAQKIMGASLLADANALLRDEKCDLLSDTEWHEFREFLDASVKANAANPYANYPVSSITGPLFQAGFAYAGTAIGYLIGTAAAESTHALRAKNQLTLGVASSLIFLRSTGPFGAALFAQVIAGKLFTTFSSVSMAHIMGTVFGILGRGVGVAVGLPLDVAYLALWKACTVINDYCKNNPDACANLLTGTRIHDGMHMIAGQEFSIKEMGAIKEESSSEPPVIEYQNGEILIPGEKPVPAIDWSQKLPPELVAELRKQILAINTTEAEPTAALVM